ncbi:hypothetical protein C0995_002583 [Termitomyces sp. Mi166|nr:hypothetical protein C0995_002583 [Termitomyces sp. Mi166\
MARQSGNHPVSLNNPIMQLLINRDGNTPLMIQITPQAQAQALTSITLSAALAAPVLASVAPAPAPIAPVPAPAGPIPVAPMPVPAVATSAAAPTAAPIGNTEAWYTITCA